MMQIFHSSYDSHEGTDSMIKSKDVFMKENEEKQKLKEYFVSDLKAFIDYASLEKSSQLDYLELDIPGTSLYYLRMNTDFSKCQPHLYISRPNPDFEEFHLYTTGYNGDGSYDSFSSKEFQLNDKNSCELIENSVFETKWQKLFKLNGKHIFKFKFYFQKYGHKHQEVIFGGQSFSFDFFQFHLRKPEGKNRLWIACRIAKCGYFRVKNKKEPHHFPTPKHCVEILDNARLIFKFIFYRNGFESPLKNFQPNYFEKKPNFYIPYLNSQNNFCYTQLTQDEYNMFQNFNFQNHYYYTSKTNNMLQNYKESSFEEYDGFEENPFFEENIFDEENSTVEITEDSNLGIFEKQTFPSFINLEDKSRYAIECANFYKSLSKTYFKPILQRKK